MKKLAIYISMIFLVACEHDIIYLTPISELNTENFYQSEVDFKNALIAAYDALQEKNSIDFVMSEIRSDNGTEMKYQYETDCDNFTVSASNEEISRWWKIAYKGIFRANIILDKIPSADFDSTKKSQVIAQAKFIRAYIYFDLVRYFGDVPLVTKVLKLTESMNMQRESIDEVYKIIEADLKDAALVLPSIYTSSSDIGRATKGAANALLGKVYLTRNKFAESKTCLEAVLNDATAGYQLLPAFSNIFSVSGQNNKEIVFAIQYSNGTGDGNTFMNTFGPGTPGSDVSPGVGDEHNIPTVDLIRCYEPGDTRKAVTLAEYIVHPTTHDTTNNPYNRKFLGNQVMNDSGLDWPVIRFSDVILMYAEVLNELDDLPGAITQLNRIRARAFGNLLHNFDNISIPDKAAFRTKVLNERRIELAFENHRWFDLVRTGKAVEFLQVENRLADWKTGVIYISFEVKMQPFETFYPIPLDEIELSGFNLTQNEGY